MNSQQKYELRERRRRQKQQNRVGRYVVGKTNFWGENRVIFSFQDFREAVNFTMSYAWLCPSNDFRPITIWIRDKHTGELVYSQLCGFRRVGTPLYFDSMSEIDQVEKTNWKVEGF